jgi:putative transposase
VYAKLLDQGV